MAEIKNIIIKEADERLIVGLHRKTSFSKVGGVWQDFFKGKSVSKLNTLSDFKYCDDIDENTGIGFMYEFEGDENFNIIIGDFVKVGTEIPKGCFAKHIPKTLNAHIQIEGTNIPDILGSAYLLITEAIEMNGREIDYNNFYWCEVYTLQRYCEPLNRGEKVIIDYIMPVKRTINYK
ncbi:MAG: GyrI-like domain-containing protein [Lachnospiraceae bacterium]